MIPLVTLTGDSMITMQLNSNIHITFIADGTIALSPAAQFKGIIDGKAVFTMSGYTIDGIDYEYNVGVEYKDEPALLEYLKAQNLQQPTKEQILAAGFGFSF